MLGEILAGTAGYSGVGLLRERREFLVVGYVQPGNEFGDLGHIAESRRMQTGLRPLQLRGEVGDRLHETRPQLRRGAREGLLNLLIDLAGDSGLLLGAKRDAEILATGYGEDVGRQG